MTRAAAAARGTRYRAGRAPCLQTGPPGPAALRLCPPAPAQFDGRPAGSDDPPPARRPAPRDGECHVGSGPGLTRMLLVPSRLAVRLTTALHELCRGVDPHHAIFPT